MRNMFALIGMLVVGVGGAGWYLGWYKVNVAKNPQGNLQIQTEVDTKKLSGDSAAFFQKMGQMASEQAQKAGQNTSTGQPAATPGNTPGPVTPPKDSPPQGSGLAAPNTPVPPPGGMQ